MLSDAHPELMRMIMIIQYDKLVYFRNEMGELHIGCRHEKFPDFAVSYKVFSSFPQFFIRTFSSLRMVET